MDDSLIRVRCVGYYHHHEDFPPNTQCVRRPSKYGNPYRLTEYSRGEALKKFAADLQKTLSENPHFLDPLRGKNLACYCPLTEKCHADILLHYANLPQSDGLLSSAYPRSVV
ncbi:MAG TPA: DUF4326 domain-containing protein [Candidatus Angelobacter sp.]|nr:DUF4326 domain-containing protein [Candidatus Angelobacter sp.]